MDLPLNKFKRALKDGKPQIGIWSSFPSHIVAEVLAGSKFDWVLLDTEHSPNDVPIVHTQLMAFAGSESTPIVRPAWNDMVLIKRYLDIGAQTLLLPYVQSEQEAKNAVTYTRYPQQGVRGVAGATRAVGYGRTPDYLKRASGELCVLVQVETRNSELEEAKRLHKKLRCPILDVSELSVEETAMRIIRLVERRHRAENA